MTVRIIRMRLMESGFKRHAPSSNGAVLKPDHIVSYYLVFRVPAGGLATLAVIAPGNQTSTQGTLDVENLFI